MADEILFHHRTTMVRRLRLAPGEAMPWHFTSRRFWDSSTRTSGDGNRDLRKPAPFRLIRESGKPVRGFSRFTIFYLEYFSWRTPSK